MPRTTADLVKGVLTTDYDSRRLPSLTPFIATASFLVDDLEAAPSNVEAPLSSDRLEMIERWLAAHFYKSAADKAYSSRRNQGAAGVFQGRTGMYLEATTYGQQAMILDSSGYLISTSASRSGQKVASMEWLGLPDSEQLDYDERN